MFILTEKLLINRLLATPGLILLMWSVVESTPIVLFEVTQFDVIGDGVFERVVAD